MVEVGSVLDNKIEILISRGHILHVNDKYYKLKKETYKEDGKTREKEIFEEIDIDEYANKVRTLAEKIAEMPNVKLVDIIEDALTDYPLDRFNEIKTDIEEEIERAEEEDDEPEIKTKSSFCTEILIGKHTGFVVRE